MLIGCFNTSSQDVHRVLQSVFIGVAIRVHRVFIGVAIRIHRVFIGVAIRIHRVLLDMFYASAHRSTNAVYSSSNVQQFCAAGQTSINYSMHSLPSAGQE